MGEKRKPKPDDPEQSKRFKEAAKTHGGMDENAFAKALDAIVKPGGKGSRKKSGE